MTSLLRAEFIKILKRLNIWVMLFILLLFQNIPVIMAILGKLNEPSKFYLPTIFTTQLSSAATTTSLMAILILIFTVSSVGGEYGWGTLRIVLARGVSRREFIAAKLIAALLVLLLWFLALLLLSLPLGWGVMASTNQQVSLSFLSLSGAGVFLEYLARAYFTVLPAVVIGFFWTIVGRSLGVGMGASIVHVVVADPLLFQLFRSLGGFWADISPYTMMALGKSVATFVDDVSPAYLSNQWSAVFLLVAYITVFGVAALRIFQKSDIRFTAS